MDWDASTMLRNQSKAIVKGIVLGCLLTWGVCLASDAYRDAQARETKRGQDTLNLLFAKSLTGDSLTPKQKKALDAALDRMVSP